MSIIRKVLEDRYRDLACLAYLIADDGNVDEQRLAADVHRALWEAVPRGPRRAGQSAADSADAYSELRRRLLDRLVNGPRHDGRLWRWCRALTRPRLPGWLRLTATVPWRGGEARSLVVQRTAAGRARLALAVVDGLTAAQAREVLNAAGVDVSDRYAAAAAGDATVPGATVPGADELRPVVAAFDASLVRCGPGWLTRARRQRRVLTAAGAVVVVIAACVAGITAWNDAPHSGDPVVTSLTTWTHAIASGSGGQFVSDWPTRGNLAGDRPLLRAAAAAFSAAQQLEPGDTVYVLYAGDLSGTGPLVVMADAEVPEAAVASYRPGAAVPLRQLGSYDADDQTSPNLIPLPGGRLLVPPWRTGLRLAWLSGAGTPLRWQPLPVSSGIATMPAQQRVNPDTCFGRVAAIQYDDNTFGRSLRFTGTDLVAPQDGNLSAWPTEIESNGGPQNVPLLPLQELGDVSCGYDAPSVDWLYDGGFQLDVTNLGQGTLPGPGGAAVAAVTVDVQDASLRTPILADSSLFDGIGTEFLNLGTGQTAATGPGSAGGSPLQVTGAWWKAASGRWYLLTAGAPGLRAFGAGGALGAVAHSASFTVFSAGSATPASLGPVLVDAPAKNGPEAATVLPPTGG